jgi:hypothetical protein
MWSIPLVLMLALAALGPTLAFTSEHRRYTGRVQSIIPGKSVLVVEVLSENQTVKTVEVDAKNAKIVRLLRDPAQPWKWVEQPIQVFRLSAGTFVVVIGGPLESGVIGASRIEVPVDEPK